MISSPTSNFVKKIAQGVRSLRANFYKKFEIFAILNYLGPYFCTHNVEILLGVPRFTQPVQGVW